MKLFAKKRDAIRSQKTAEIWAKSVLNKSGIEGVDYVVNPYVGCAHRCAYCYASFMKRFSGHREPWGWFVDVKVNAPEVLARQLKRAAPASVLLSSVTDPYQPLERKYQLTRRCLEELAKHQELEVSILTKSDLALRDIDLFKRIGNCSVGFTITSARDEVARIFEPIAPPPSRRLAALRKLAQEGIETLAFFGPILPYFSDNDDAVEELFQRFAEAKVGRVIADRMNFYPSVKARVFSLLRGRCPEAIDSVREALYYEDAYSQELRVKVWHWAARFDLPCEVIF